jgi:AcrR family transcriptional regulator
MPRPRFDKLPKDKRERILEAAAKEFVAHGYEGASMNRMLAEAGISKGAAYYYFDDKADLYATAVLYYSRALLPNSFDPSTVTAERYWDEITALYQHQFTSYADRPWVFGLAKAGGAFSAEMMAQGPLSEFLEQAQSLLAQILRRGRELGLVRDDLPEDLLLSLMIAVDDAHDQWLIANWASFTQADLESAAVRSVDLLRRVLAPESSE